MEKIITDDEIADIINEAFWRYFAKQHNLQGWQVAEIKKRLPEKPAKVIVEVTVNSPIV